MEVKDRMSKHHIANIQTKGKSWRKNSSKEPGKKKTATADTVERTTHFEGGMPGIRERMQPLPKKKPLHELLQIPQGKSTLRR